MTRTTVLRVVYVALAAWMAVAFAQAVAFPGVDLGVVLNRWVHVGLLAIATVLCLWSAAVRSRDRVAWALIGAGTGAWTLGEAYYTGALWASDAGQSLSAADIGFLATPLLILAGMVQLMRGRPTSPAMRVDAVIAGLVVGAFSAAIIFETVLDAAEGDALAVAVNLAYPLLDLVLLSVAVATIAASGWRLERAWFLLVAGIGLFWVADSAYLIQAATEAFDSGGIVDVTWWAGLSLISFASWQPARRAGVGDERPTGRRLILAPLAFAVAGLGLLIFGSFGHLSPLAVALAAAALLAVMGRLAMTFDAHAAMLEVSREEALADPLTGMPNRRALARDIDAMLAATEHGGTGVLVMFDLNGFKVYNDTFGHPAGDALLVRLGHNLTAFLSGRGTGYRIGGDEFCALFATGPDIAEPVIVGAVNALSEHGDGFSITTSHGSIMLPLEAANAADAMKLADQRMYADKTSGRVSASRQSTDVLLRALTERNPGLTAHLRGVAELASDLAGHLALPGDDVERIHQAAELHDVGKVAVPDEILNKPGPLEPDEWAFVRGHTLVGERIIAAAPALAGVARLVRSTHEQWDGSGYPDGLKGPDILLGARVIAVADAFDAMTNHRPYAKVRSTELAIAELRRCAGSQFDPMVVDAFCRMWALRCGAVTTA